MDLLDIPSLLPDQRWSSLGLRRLITVTIVLVVVFLIDLGPRVALAAAGFVTPITIFGIRDTYQVRETIPKDFINVCLRRMVNMQS